jgi:heptosyltransferase II
MNILVIRFSSMGDVVLVTAFFEYLIKEHPESRIYLLTDSRYAGLFKDDDRLSGVVGCQKPYCAEDLHAKLPPSFDRIIDLQNNRHSSSICRLYPECGYTGRFKKMHMQRLLLLLTRIDTYGVVGNVACRYVQSDGKILDDKFAPPDLRVMLDPLKCDEVYGNLFGENSSRRTLALVPFSAWRNKEWPWQYYMLVGRYFHAKGWNVAVLGGPEDKVAAESLAKKTGERCVPAAGGINLYQTACLLARCSLALGNDTGLSHLARACGVRTGVVFGSTTRHFGFYPYGLPQYRIFESSQFCRPCHPHGGNLCIFKYRPCLKKVRPEAVMKGLDELLSGC